MCWRWGQLSSAVQPPEHPEQSTQSTQHPGATRGQWHKDDAGKGAACPEQGKGPEPPAGSAPVTVTSVTGTRHGQQGRAARGEPAVDTRVPHGQKRAGRPPVPPKRTNPGVSQHRPRCCG